MLRSGCGLGYWPDEQSDKDRAFELMGIGYGPPSRASVTQWMPQIVDQFSTESCVGEAMRYAYYVEEYRQSGMVPEPTSALGHYFNARAQQGIEDMDVGCNPRAALQALKYHGALREADWPFDAEKVNVRPAWRAFRNAFDSRGPHRYYRIATQGSERVRDLQRAIAAGHAPIFGTRVTKQFTSGDGPETEDTPQPGDDIAGGHMMTIVEYEPGRMLIANSWGLYYRMQGYVWLTEEYLCDDSTQDIWVLAL